MSRRSSVRCATRDTRQLAAYIDTSVLASIIVEDAHTERVRLWLPTAAGRLTLSDWTVTEFTSAVGAVQRAGRMTADERQAAERAVDAWVARSGAALPVLSEDIRQARSLMTATAQALKAPDALHLAIVRRTGATLASLDTGMRRAAADLGVALETI
ncbi:MAG TPA: type II toxin-antitoxin system VapC family toxin [Caulobacteraceae bacterium]|nr:type II toxin-antitoxin system VapC family toxin [Caulobacteraceae bacterium]